MNGDQATLCVMAEVEKLGCRVDIAGGGNDGGVGNGEVMLREGKTNT